MTDTPNASPATTSGAEMKPKTPVMILVGEMAGTIGTITAGGLYWVDVKDHHGRSWAFRHSQITSEIPATVTGSGREVAE